MTTETVEFEVPLPPPQCRANSRSHWARRSAAALRYSESVYVAVARQGVAIPREPWKSANVTYTWHYCNGQPDRSNLGGHTKLLQDLLCMAPPSATKRYYLGIVEDDRHIWPTYQLVKVPHRINECVHVRIERREEHQG